MKKVNINYNDTFATKHSRDYYRGASFHYSGKWLSGAHYLSDDYNIDFVVHGQVLLACAKSHLSTLDNEPINYIYDENHNVIDVVSNYWDFVLSGIHGVSSGIKIVDKYWYICDDTTVPVDQQVWYNTGVKATFELTDLSEEDIQVLQQPGIDAVNQKVQYNTTAYWNSQNNYIPRAGDIIIYSDYKQKSVNGETINIPGIKIGSGNAYLADLSFIDDLERDQIINHVDDAVKHVTSEERNRWDNKLGMPSTEVDGETLILTRN